MPILKEIYPLYLANEAQQPNTDLEVTDKFTGKVAFRVAQADAATIDAGIAAAVEATEPMARLASYERQAVLMHCVKRLPSGSTSWPMLSASRLGNRSRTVKVKSAA
jgi:acyl-CoA reductase-like NAD-dependent aldehyde dehydrogenase